MDGVSVRKIRPAFADARGEIFDLFEKEIRHVGLIRSEKGSVRGNHYHKKSTQYMYMISGRLEMKVKDARTGVDDSFLLEKGDVVTIQPLVVHAFKALEETVFLDCTTESRKDTGYEDDTVRVQIM